MQAFLERFIADVDANLDDPQAAKRLGRDTKLRLLRVAEKMIWESLLMVSGQESIIGRAETTITIEDEKEFYLLPGNFRQFLGFERREDGDSNNVTARMRSIPLYDPGPGVVILSEQRGMMIKSRPRLNDSEVWTLIYQKGPVALHYGATTAVGDQTLTAAAPETDAGEMILNDGYYTGSLLMIYDAATGSEQIREITEWKANSRVFGLRHAWGTKPTGNVKYEIRPILPPDYDDLYAMDVAIRVMGRRRRATGRIGLKQDRKLLWTACMGYFLSNVADRAPARLLPVDVNEMDPYD
jgi:hypothetical protein